MQAFRVRIVIAGGGRGLPGSAQPVEVVGADLLAHRFPELELISKPRVPISYRGIVRV